MPRVDLQSDHLAVVPQGAGDAGRAVPAESPELQDAARADHPAEQREEPRLGGGDLDRGQVRRRGGLTHIPQHLVLEPHRLVEECVDLRPSGLMVSGVGRGGRVLGHGYDGSSGRVPDPRGRAAT